MLDEKELMKELRAYVKDKKIPHKYLADEMGCTITTISNRLSDKGKSSIQFNKLLVLAVCNFMAKDMKGLQKIVEGTTWEPVLSSLF